MNTAAPSYAVLLVRSSFPPISSRSPPLPISALLANPEPNPSLLHAPSPSSPLHSSPLRVGGSTASFHGGVRGRRRDRGEVPEAPLPAGPRDSVRAASCCRAARSRPPRGDSGKRVAVQARGPRLPDHRPERLPPLLLRFPEAARVFVWILLFSWICSVFLHQATAKSVEEVSEEHFTKSLQEVQEQHLSVGNNINSCPNAGGAQHGTNSCVDGVLELEQLLKQKTFTRKFDRMTQLLRSRTVEPSTPEVAVNSGNKEMANVPYQANNKQQCAIEPTCIQPASSYYKNDKEVVSEQEERGIIGLNGNDATPVNLIVPKEEAALPTEIAKAYMSSRPFKVSPANLTGQNKLFHEDKALPSGTPYGKKISDRPMALRSAVCISGPPETKPNIYINPKLNGRTAIYKMSRSPYFKPHLMGDKLLMDGYGGPSSSSQSMSTNIVHSGGRQMLKRRSSVLDDDIGSFGPTRRTRQKSNLMSPLKSSYSSVGHFLPSSSTRVDRGSIIPRHKLYHLNEQKNNHAESQTSENGGMPIVPVPLQSSEMARKILQQLDKLAPSPKEKSSKLKIDTNDSPHMLTQNMLGGRALKSMEEIDTSKFLNVQVNGSLEVASESHQEGYVISYKKDETEENASTEHAVKGVHVVSTASILKKPNIVGTEANPTVATANVAVVPGADTIFTGKKPSFQMSAPEDLDMLDDDIYNIKNSSSPAVIVDNKSKSNSEVEIIHVAKTNLEKSVESSSIGMHVSTAILDRDPQKINNCSSTDKMDGFPFPAVPASNSFQLPSVCPMLVASLEKSATQNEEVTASTNKIFYLFNACGSAASSGLSTLTSSGINVFGVSTTSKLNDEAASLTSTTSLVPDASVVALDSLCPSGFSTSISTMPCPSIAVSHAAPALSTTSSFQFNTGGFLGASSPVISSTEKCGPANLIESESSTFSISSSATLGTSAATSVSVSMISSSSALPVSPLFSTASDFLAGSTSSSFSTSSSGLFSFGASSQSSGAKSLIFSNNPQSLTKFGDTAGSTFSTQLAVSGTGMSNLLPSSSGTFGSSTPVPIFGTSDTSSSGSASSSFGFSTSATKPLSSSSSFCFSSVTGSSSNSGSISTFVPATNFGSSSSFPFSGATVSSLGAGSSNSLVSTPPFGSSSFSFSTGGTLSTKFGDNNSSVGGTGIALFSSSSQTSQSSVSASTFGSTISAPATGFPFASPHSGSSPFTFGASVPAFSFTSIGSTNSSTSSAQPVFGVPNQIASLNSPGNDQMNVEDSMADDPAQSISPAATFGQPNLLASPNFMFGAPAAPGGLSTFQFGSQQNSFIPQSQSPFQQSVNADFAGGGSFSLGSSGGEKSGRRIVRVRRDKHRKKALWRHRSVCLLLCCFARSFSARFCSLMAPPLEPTGDERQQLQAEEGEVVTGEEENKDAEWCYQWPVFRFDRAPRRLYHFRQQFMAGDCPGCNFFKGVKWSPDGSCFLTSSDDNTLRLFYLPEDAFTDRAECTAADIDGPADSYVSSLIVGEAETVYDYCWFPYMSASDPATCVFASTTRDHPIHLWDANSGQLRCTYRAYDAMDEITAALSVCFNTSGSKLFAGYNKFLRVFDVHRPGREFQQHSLLKGNDGPSGSYSCILMFSRSVVSSDCSFGIVSSIAFSPTHTGMLAIGSYSQMTAIYSEDNMELLYVLHGQLGGVTQVLFSKDGNYLYTGGRKDPYILCWDIRNTIGIVYQLYRSSEHTNQRISFDIEPCGRHLGTGGEDGLVHIYDLQTGEWATSFQAASDTVNGFSFHPSLPLAASSSGNRRFDLLDNVEEKLSFSGDQNCASVWSFSGSLELGHDAAITDEALDSGDVSQGLGLV
ncbi:unnamed protein product [Musa textilis]